MEELNKMVDALKSRTEEAFECYANKEHWEPQDLKCAKEAAELYDKLQTIQMNNGIWEGIKEGGEYSQGRAMRMSYGDSYARGRGMDGRFVSRGHDMYDGGYAYGDNMGGRSGRGNSYRDGGASYRDNGTSMHSVKDQAIQRLESLMDTAESEYERQEIMKMIETIEKQKR